MAPINCLSANMVKTLVIHAGTEKTGSTALQHVLHKNEAVLRDDGYVFPPVLGPKNHVHLTAASLDDDTLDNIKAHVLAKHCITTNQLRDEITRGLARELQNDRQWHTIIASSELIHSRLVQPSEIRRLHGFFEPYVDTTKIVLYIRRQDRLAISRVSTALRAGFRDFERIFDDIGDHQYFHTPQHRYISDFDHYYNYKNIIERFYEITDQSNIHVYQYPESSEATQSIIRNFSEAAGLDRRKLSFPEARFNESLPVEAQYLMSEINKTMDPWWSNGLRNKSLKKLHSAIEERGGSQRRLVSRRDARAFVAKFDESNDWVRTHHFPSSENLFDSDYGDYPEEIRYDFLAEQLAPIVEEFKSLATRLPQREHPLRSFYRRYKRRVSRTFKGLS